MSYQWERSRNRYGLWHIADNRRLAYIGRAHGGGKWLWSIDVAPYTSGSEPTAKAAKRKAEDALTAAMPVYQPKPKYYGCW